MLLEVNGEVEVKVGSGRQSLEDLTLSVSWGGGDETRWQPQGGVRSGAGRWGAGLRKEHARLYSQGKEPDEIKGGRSR